MHASVMKHLTLVILLALAPLSWGEDVYYCVEEHHAALEPTDSGDAYELKRYRPEPSTLKYEAESNRLAIKGRLWGGDDLSYIDCHTCLAVIGSFYAGDDTSVFVLRESRFNFAAAFPDSTLMKTGTCTKF